MAESIKARLRRSANRLLRPLGLHLQRADRAFEMEDLLRHAAARGFQPATVVDVGASDGIWSLRARRHFPAARQVLFEPLAEHAPALARLQARHGFVHIAAVAGPTSGTVAFSVAGDLDGSGVALASDPVARRVTQTTIDETVARQGLKGPYCLKLDTHGYELPVLAGASALLANTGLLIIEAYNFQLGEGTLRFAELCAWLEARGFRCCDLADPMRRPSDGVLWQMDLAFAPASSRFFSRAHYD